MFSLGLLIASVLLIRVSAVTVNLVEFVQLENPAKYRRWFSGTDKERIAFARSNGYDVELSNGGLGMMVKTISQEAKDACGENLVEVHEIRDANAMQTLSSLSKDAILATPGLTYLVQAGYLAKRPYACGAGKVALIEMYSTVKNQSFFVSGPANFETHLNDNLEVYPKKVLGYLFHMKPTPQVTFTASNIGHPGAFEGLQPVKMNPIIRMTQPWQHIGTVTTQDRVTELKGKAWTYNSTSVATIFAPEEEDCMSLKRCGPMVKLVEVWDNANQRLYVSPRNEVPTGHGIAKTFGLCPMEYDGCGAKIAFNEHYNKEKKNFAYSTTQADATALRKAGYIFQRTLCYLRDTNWAWLPKSTC